MVKPNDLFWRTLLLLLLLLLLLQGASVQRARKTPVLTSRVRYGV